MKRLLSLAVALLLALAMLAPAAVAESSDNWLRIFFTDNPETLDVQKTTDSYTIPLNCFDRLVETDTVDGEAQIVPGLADRWEISEDGLSYTFHLHEGVTFQNGDPLTADDVVYTVNRMMDPATGAKNTDIFDVVVGATAMYNGEAESVEGVVALDDNSRAPTRPSCPAWPRPAAPSTTASPPRASTTSGRTRRSASALAPSR